MVRKPALPIILSPPTERHGTQNTPPQHSRTGGLRSASLLHGCAAATAPRVPGEPLHIAASLWTLTNQVCLLVCRGYFRASKQFLVLGTFLSAAWPMSLRNLASRRRQLRSAPLRRRAFAATGTWFAISMGFGRLTRRGD